MATSTAPTRTVKSESTEAPLRLTTEPPRTLGFLDQLTMWGNLGISLFGPVTGALIAAFTGSVATAVLATVVGCTIGAVILGASAVFGSATGAPAMACMRGLFGRAGSAVPTVLNIAQNIGWATLEIVLIAAAASAALGGQDWRWAYVLGAGVLATAMAIRPLGSVRALRKVLVWLVLAASVYLFVEVLSRPLGEIPDTAVYGFWPAVDLAVAGVVSFAPLAADYSRHSHSDRAAFGGAAVGYGAAAIAYYTLGVLAVAALATDGASFAALTDGGNGIVLALASLPAGAVMLAVLTVDEVDEAFANVYSTTMSVHNLAPRLDRRWISLAIGVMATLLALLIDMSGYQNFLFLLASVFVPLFAVAATDFFLVSRRRWDLSDTARLRWQPLVAWLAGFGTYQLIYPGTLPGWSSFWYDLRDRLGWEPPGWFGSSLGSIAVAALVMLVLGGLSRRTAGAR